MIIDGILETNSDIENLAAIISEAAKATDNLWEEGEMYKKAFPELKTEKRGLLSAVPEHMKGNDGNY